MLFKPLLALSLAVSATAQWLFPQPTQGGISMIQEPGGNDIRIYYQPSSGDILQLLVSGPFDVGGHVYALPELMVRSAEVRAATPIAAGALGNSTWGEIHLFFFSPALVLSHYYWTPELGVRGGSTCSECLTSLRIKVLFSTTTTITMYPLSVSTDSVNNVVSVLYMDANTKVLSEAVRRNGEWTVGRLD